MQSSNRAARHAAAMLAPALLWSVAVAPRALAQNGFRQPPAVIAQVLDARPAPSVRVSPTRNWLLLEQREGLEPITWVARRHYSLAGERIDPRTNHEARTPTALSLAVRSIDGKTTRTLQTPAGVRVAFASWSDDGAHVSFVALTDTGSTLWVSDVATGNSHQVGTAKVNPAAGAPCDWIDANRLVCRTIPSDRGAEPKESEIPTGPVAVESSGRPEPVATLQDLLASPLDEARFEYFFASQLAIMSLDGQTTRVGAPGQIVNARPSPDGRYFAVETVHRPWSYTVGWENFARRSELWDANGTVVRQLSDRPLNETSQFASDAVLPGPRNVNWRPDVPATLVWVQEMPVDGASNPANADAGAGRRAPRRDRVFLLSAPFTGEPTRLADLENRYSGITWASPTMAFLTESQRRQRRVRTWIINPSNPSGAPRLLWDRSSEDRYGDPGSFVLTRGSAGGFGGGGGGGGGGGERIALLSRDNRYAYLEGNGASPEGDRPFLDRLDLATLKSERLWRSAAPYYEEVVSVVDPDARRVLTRRESQTEPPNYVLRDVKAGTFAKVTDFADPAPMFAGVTKQVITYPRADGVQLQATLYLPAGYDKSQGPLPFLLWAYPREFLSAAAASQVQGSPYRFTRPSGESHLFLLSQGYGVLDGPSMPIIAAPGKEPNDTYIEQLVSSAKAAVDKIVEMGVADRDRIAAGGHSYGAFMTANLLAHSNLFRAGIARDGAYNRSLTPFGFQDEPRSFWRAQELYRRMSPFFYADSIRVPLLLTHGGMDDNTGTFPIQSERMFAALKGNGTRVRWVVLPNEAHHARARENVGHLQWEMLNWLDTYVKPKRSPSTAVTGAGEKP